MKKLLFLTLTLAASASMLKGARDICYCVDQSGWEEEQPGVKCGEECNARCQRLFGYSAMPQCSSISTGQRVNPYLVGSIYDPYSFEYKNRFNR